MESLIILLFLSARETRTYVGHKGNRCVEK